MCRDFEGDLRWSKQAKFRRQEIYILQQLFPSAAVRAGTVAEDKQGADYVVSCAGRAVAFVDVKRRNCGASKFWSGSEPDIPIEVPAPAYAAHSASSKVYSVPDWCKSNSLTTHRLHVFDESDYEPALFFSYDELKAAVRENLGSWMERYHSQEQSSVNSGHDYGSKVLFVPVSELQRRGVHVSYIYRPQTKKLQRANTEALL